MRIECCWVMPVEMEGRSAFIIGRKRGRSEKEGYGLAAAYLVALKVCLLNVAISIQIRNESG